MIKMHLLGGAVVALESNDPSHRKKVTSMRYEGKAMAEDCVKMTVASTEEISFAARNYVVYDERLYFLNRMPKAKMVGRSMYEYDLVFEGGMYELARARFDASALSPTYGFDMCGSLYDFCRLVAATMDNLNGGGGLWWLDFETEGGAPVATDEKVLTYEGDNCLAVLQDLVTQWPEWEWRVVVEEGDIANGGYVGGVLKVRRKQAGSRFTGNDYDMAYGRKGGLTSVEKAPYRGEMACNRVYFFGGNRNVFGNYRWTRVLLPTAQDGASSCVTRNLTPVNAVYERTEIVEDIYPANKPFVLTSYVGLSDEGTRVRVPNVRKKGTDTSVTETSEDTVTINLSTTEVTARVFELSMDDGTVDPQTGQLVGTRNFFNLFGKWKARGVESPWGCDYAEWLRMYGATDGTESRDRYDTYFVGKSCYIATEKPTITFQTGQCAGMSFVIWNGSWEANEEGEATCTLLCLCQEHVDEYTSDDFTPIEIEAQTLPNETLHPEAGDKFVLDGIYMPPRYLYYGGEGDHFSAEGQLKDYADAFMEATAGVTDIAVTISDEWTYRMTAADPTFAIRLYDTISVNDTDFMEELEGYPFRVVGVDHDILRGSYRVTLSMHFGASELQLLRDFLRRLRQ